MKSGKTGIRRVVNAAFYSWAGIRYAWINESAFRQEVTLAVILIPAAFWVGSDALQRALLVGTCLIVLIVELLNSAIEAVVDRFGDEYHKLSGSAKDLGSAAVFFSLLLTVIVWGLVIYERFF
jgi:diacylglycerol kinase (ATP)